MSSSSSWLLCLLSALIAAPTHADTKRMQDVTALLGIDQNKNSAAAQEAEAAAARLVERGLASHPTLKSREADLQASRARVDAAQGAYQPTLSVNGSLWQTHRRDDETDVRSRSDNQDLNLVLRENLWRGGQDAGQVSLARQDESLAEIRKFYEGEGLTLRLTRATLDYNFRFLRQLIADASLAEASELRALAERKFSAGQVGKIDIHLTSMRESAARASVARAAIETQQAYHDLLIALGPQESSAAIAQDIQALTKATLPFPAALPDLKPIQEPTLSEKNSLALQKRAEITLDQTYRSRYFPQIDLVGSLGQDSSRSWLVDNEDQKNKLKGTDATVQLQFSWNLWDRSQDHLIRAAAADKNAAGADVDALRHEVSMESQRLRTLIVDLHKSLSIAREAYVQAGQLYDAQRRLYESGVIALQALMDAERELRDSIGAWQQSVYELQLSLQRWQALQKGFLSSTALPNSRD